jgi:hypothetical protein
VSGAVSAGKLRKAGLDDVKEPNQAFAYTVALGEGAGEIFLAQRG